MKYIFTFYYDHWWLKMLMENVFSLWFFLKYEQQTCEAGTHRNNSKFILSKSVNSGLKICLQIHPFLVLKYVCKYFCFSVGIEHLRFQSRIACMTEISFGPKVNTYFWKSVLLVFGLLWFIVNKFDWIEKKSYLDIFIS